MKYEITYLVTTEEQRKDVLELIKAVGATYQDIKEWGKRELAYPIGNATSAYYYTGVIDALPATISELKRKLNFSKAALRYLIIKHES
jgi:small subunit ribosomal protein S6